MTDSSGWSSPDSGDASRYPQYPQYPQSGGGQGPAGSPGKPGVIPLRPLSLGEIVDGAITTMRRHAAVVFGASAVVALISALLYLAADLWVLDSLNPVVVDSSASQQEQLDQAMAALGDSLSATGVIAIISLLTQTFLTGFLMVVVGKAVLGKSIGFGEAWNELKPRLLPLLGLTIVVTILVAIGTLLLIIPGIWAYVVLSLATPALILERGRIGQSMRRSSALVRGSWWRVFGVLVVAMIITFVIGFIIQIPFGFATGSLTTTAPTVTDLIINEVGAAVAQTITVPFVASVTALLYIDQRMRKEGLDIELARAAGSQ